MTIADRIKNTRIERGYTQEDIARKLGCSSRSSVSQIEKSGDNVTSNMIRKYAKILHVTEAYLMGWEEIAVNNIPHDTTEILNIIKQLPSNKYNELLRYAKYLLMTEEE